MRRAMAWAIALLLVAPVFAGEKDYGVRLIVDGDAEARKQVFSYLARELRGLHDVEISDHDLDLELHAIVTRVTAPNSLPMFSVVVAVLDTKSLGRIKGLMRLECGEKTDAAWKLVEPELAHAYVIDDWISASGSQKQLPEMASHIVTAFDTKTLEPWRLWWRKYDTEMKEKPKHH